MSFSRRARLVRAQSSREPAWDVLPLGMLRRAVDSFSSQQAVKGMGSYNVLIDTSAPPMALPCALRLAGISDHVSSLFESPRRVLQTSKEAVARSTLKRTVRAHRLARLFVMQGLKKRGDLAAALEPGSQAPRKWFVRAVRRLVPPGVARRAPVPEVRSYPAQVEVRAGRVWCHPDRSSSPGRG